ncbi:hypothetical protein [Mycetocola sp.]|nr:hypothetical protein [Mycetocola sp.]MCU1560510.1 hypothetical protein [Mycetocola sp.]
MNAGSSLLLVGQRTGEQLVPMIQNFRTFADAGGLAAPILLAGLRVGP